MNVLLETHERCSVRDTRYRLPCVFWERGTQLRDEVRFPEQALPETIAVPVRVLIADDNEDSRYVMGSILGLSPGATVVAEASDGQAAIACVRDVHPDFVLIDRVMPVMDGLEATRRIKQEWPDLKVLVVTSQYGDDSRLAALAAGADGFLDKWDITTDLVPTILRLARGSHRL
jgi:CheY-like chemotaxis protein